MKSVKLGDFTIRFYVPILPRQNESSVIESRQQISRARNWGDRRCACKEKVGKLYSMGSRGESSQEAKCSRVAKKQDMASVMVKAKHASVPLQKKKMRNPTRRSLRIKNSVDPAENLSNEPQFSVLIDSDSETEVELGAKNKSAEPVIETPGLENGDGRKKKGGRPQKVKKTQESVNKPPGMNPDVAAGRTQEDQRIYNAVKTQDVVNKPCEMNDGLAAGRAEEEQRVKNAEKTQEVVNKHRGINDGLVAGRAEEEQHVDNAEQTQEAATEPVERSSSQNNRDRESRYKTLYIKAMRRLDAVTEERNVLSRQLAVAQVKIGVLHDFRDQLSEVTEKLDVANERLEVYQKTMNPQMVGILRDFLTATNQSQTTEVPMNTSSEKDTGTDKATKPPIRSSKRHKHK
ncbi:hypothetical protein QQ045_003387 [Rhodiola kirilowii]